MSLRQSLICKSLGHIPMMEGEMDEQVIKELVNQGVFKGAEGLEGLAEADEFWKDQDYGTRLYYGPGIAEYLHRDVLRAAVQALKNKGPE